MAPFDGIDLGDEVKLKVRYAGKDYNLREPSVGEIEGLKNSDSDKIDIPEFLSKLGMPSEVTRAMSLSKAKMLMDAMMDFVTKKK